MCAEATARAALYSGLTDNGCYVQVCTFVGNTIHERVGLRRRLSRVHTFITWVVMDGVHILLVPVLAATSDVAPYGATYC